MGGTKGIMRIYGRQPGNPALLVHTFKLKPEELSSHVLVDDDGPRIELHFGDDAMIALDFPEFDHVAALVREAREKRITHEAERLRRENARMRVQLADYSEAQHNCCLLPITDPNGGESWKCEYELGHVGSCGVPRMSIGADGRFWNRE
jgi:hypothetical protein